MTTYEMGLRAGLMTAARWHEMQAGELRLAAARAEAAEAPGTARRLTEAADTHAHNALCLRRLADDRPLAVEPDFPMAAAVGTA